MAIFDNIPKTHRRLRLTITSPLLLASVLAPVAAQITDPVIPVIDGAESSATRAERALDVQRIEVVIAALREDKDPPFPVWFTETPRRFKKILLRLGKLESARFLREQKRERVYELWFAGGRLIWGISDPLPHEPPHWRVVLVEHL